MSEAHVEAANGTDNKSTDPEPPTSPAPNPKGADLIRELGFWKLVAEDYRTHHRKLLSPGFQAIFTYRFGTWANKMRGSGFLGKLVYLPSNLLWHIMYRWVRNFLGIELEKTVQVGRRVELAHQHGIVIHSYARIGDDVLIRHNVTFGMGAEMIVPGEGPLIGDRTTFGPGTVVMGPVTIGSDCTIGPNCTISKDVPSNSTLFVPPPRILPKATSNPPSE